MSNGELCDDLHNKNILSIPNMTFRSNILLKLSIFTNNRPRYPTYTISHIVKTATLISLKHTQNCCLSHICCKANETANLNASDAPTRPFICCENYQQLASKF